MPKSIAELLTDQILVLDGAMGTMIQRYNLSEKDFRGRRFAEHPSELKGNNDILSLTRPDIIAAIHRQYIEAGADIISTNSFNANSISQADYHTAHLVGEINRAAAAIARTEADTFMLAHPERRIFVAGSIGPTNRTASISPKMDDPAYRNVTFDMLTESYEEQLTALSEGGCDILLFETVFDTLNLKAGLTAAQNVARHSGKSLPIMVSCTIAGRAGRILSGQSIAAVLTSISHFDNILSVGLNCSWGAAEMRPFISELSSLCDRFVSCHPNAGLPDESGRYTESPEYFTRHIEEFLKDGSINIVGGCCGTTPEHIHALSHIVKSHRPRIQGKTAEGLHLAGLDAMTVSRDINFVNIGERCNVAGSRKFLRLINEKRYDDALAIARRQVDDGAQIIDINMDDAMLDAEAEMTRFLNLIASDPDTARVPVMIDSSRWDVLLSALKCVQGRAIVNSLSLKEGEETFISRAKVLRDMGAAIVVMAFDENGQADTYERKIEICAKAYKLLTEKAGVRPCDIIFDPNIMAVATGIDEHDYYARDFIRATRWIKENLHGAKVSGGVSNLSFAFRGHNSLREAIHAVFLYHAIEAGLDMAIVNPAASVTYDDINPTLRDTIEELILNGSHTAAEKLTLYAGNAADTASATVPQSADRHNLDPGARLIQAIIKGSPEYLAEDLHDAEAVYPRAIDIIEGPLMEGVSKVGTLFGEGKMFLPQVVKAARVMKQAVDMLKPRIKADKSGDSSQSAGRILFATVRGDVHDIGKNIVTIVLECNNYEVIDLGVMVPAEEIVRRAISDKPDIICLSGLITPSLAEMVNVAEKLNEAGLDIPLIVGGATTSKLHTALKIAPRTKAPVIHASDASQNPIIAARLLNPASRGRYEAEIAEEYSRLRASYHAGAGKQLLDLSSARRLADHHPETSAVPLHPGITTLEKLPTSEISELINWRMLFHAWGLTGSLPNEYKNTPKATECIKLYDDAKKILGSLPEYFIRAAVAIYDAHSHDDNLIIGDITLPMLRRQQPGEDGRCRCLADYVNPEKDFVGLFAINAASGVQDVIDRYESSGDRYSSLLLRSLLDRLAEAASEYVHCLVRKSIWGYARHENLSNSELFEGRYNGIRPAFGYPMLPDQTLIHSISPLLPFDKLGITLTENGAMHPQSCVCGLYIASENARYFNIGTIGTDQLTDYAMRRGISVDEARRILSKYL